MDIPMPFRGGATIRGGATMVLYTFAAIMGALVVTVGLLGSAFVSAPLPGDPSLMINDA